MPFVIAPASAECTSPPLEVVLCVLTHARGDQVLDRLNSALPRAQISGSMDPDELSRREEPPVVRYRGKEPHESEADHAIAPTTAMLTVMACVAPYVARSAK